MQFKLFLENQEIELANRVISNLYYSKGLDITKIDKMKIQDLISYISELNLVNGINMARFTGLVKRLANDKVNGEYNSLEENVDNNIDNKIKILLSKRKRNWRIILKTEPFLNLTKIYDLLCKYNENEKDYWTVVGLKNFILSVIVGCLVQKLYDDSTFNRYNLIGMASQLSIVNNLEDAISIAREIYHPNNQIRVGIFALWTTDLMRSLD